MKVLELMVLILALWFSSVYVHSRISSLVSFVIYKIDEDKKLTVLSLVLLTLAVILWAIYIVCF